MPKLPSLQNADLQIVLYLQVVAEWIKESTVR
jgi:hypothetical protein